MFLSSADLLTDQNSNLWVVLITTERRPEIYGILRLNITKRDDSESTKVIPGSTDPAHTKVSSNSGSHTAIGNALKWLRRCNEKHEDCSSQGTFVPTRLVDVGTCNDSHPGTLRLVLTENLKIEGGYTALSYCWGGNSSMRLTQANCAELQIEIDSRKLPQTISEAIDITRRLGYRYMWVDSLCIIQDMLSDWTAEALHMGEVYRCSEVTIAATASAESSKGCYRDYNILGYLPCKLPSPDTTDTKIKIDLSLGDAKSLAQKNFHRHIEYSPLMRRAWVLQERLLSRKILWFTLEGIVWECKMHRAFELEPDDLPPHEILLELQACMKQLTGPAIKISSDLLLSHSTIAPTFREVSHSGIVRGQFLEWLQNDLRLRFVGSFMKPWSEILRVYTSMALSFPTDRFAAIKGIMREVQKISQLDILAGFWIDPTDRMLPWLLPWQLLWRTGTSTLGRIPNTPTWSWISVDTSIYYRHSYLAHDCQFLCSVAKSSDLTATGPTEEGNCALKIRGRLIEHKWTSSRVVRPDVGTKVNTCILLLVASGTILHSIPFKMLGLAIQKVGSTSEEDKYMRIGWFSAAYKSYIADSEDSRIIDAFSKAKEQDIILI